MSLAVTPLWNHQKIAIERAKEMDCFGLFFQMGCGKSRTVIEMLRFRYNTERRVMRTLILAPLITLENWRNEFKKFSKIEPHQIAVLQGAGKKRLEIFQASKAKIWVMNFEGLLMEDLYDAFIKYDFEVLICDESHRLKDSKTKRTKLATKLADGVKYRYLLSGSPVLNSPMDIFSQYRILDGGETFGKNFFVFRALYFYDKNAGMPRDKYYPNWQIRPGALQQINDKIYNKAMRVTKEECLDLPPLVRQTVHVGMLPEQERVYREMKKDFISFLDSKAVVAQLALTKALRLLQTASGFVKFETGEERSFEGNPRQAALKELLETITPEHKILVWCVFKENYRQVRKVCEELGLGYVEVHGEIANKEKFANVDRFNTDPACRVFIGHPGSGGIGISLVSASYSIWYSRTFSLEQDLQAESRNHRSGSELHQKITRIDLLCPGTIEELVVEKLMAKEAIGEEILKAWREQL